MPGPAMAAMQGVACGHTRRMKQLSRQSEKVRRRPGEAYGRTYPAAAALLLSSSSAFCAARISSVCCSTRLFTWVISRLVFQMA